jgi:hypothetical protein
LTDSELQQLWSDRIANYRASGKILEKWCNDNDIPFNQIKYQIKKQNARKKDKSTTWLPVAVSDNTKQHSEALVLKVGNVSIEVMPGFDQDLLYRVVRTLAAC